MIGELSEHVYGEAALSSHAAAAGNAEGGQTVFDATVTNMGPVHRLLFHPFGDGYHLLHHLYPSVPGCRLGRLHRALKVADPETYGGHMPNRIRLLERVRRGVYDVGHTLRGYQAGRVRE
jgi:fatty acid desaturase